MIELCAGSAMLSHSFKLRKCMVLPFDNGRNRHAPKTTVYELDLTQNNAWSIIKNILDTENIILLHFGPPCGTASAARSKPISTELKAMGAPEPKPLRSKEYPMGFPWLTGLDKTKVESANKIYHLCVQCVYETYAKHIPMTLENPPNSLFWEFPGLSQACFDCGMEDFEFHGCMLGGSRKRLCRWRATAGLLTGLDHRCDDSHTHKPWTIEKQHNGWAFSTAEEAAYPFQLTEFVADRVCSFVGYVPPGDSLQLVGHGHTHASIQSGKQPRLNQSLISEFADVKQLPKSEAPNNAKLLRESVKGEKRSLSSSSMDRDSAAVYGVYRTPMEFVEEALKTKHPMDSTDAIEPSIKKAIDFVSSHSSSDICRFRLQQIKLMNDWELELRQDELKLHESLEPNIARLSKNKKLLLFKRLLHETDYPEADDLIEDVKSGFDLVGKLRNSKCLPKKIKPALVSIEELQKAAIWSRRSIIPKCTLQHDETDAILWDETIEEASKGWIRGPLTEDEVTQTLGAANWIAIRRFALRQGDKVRIIDDCKEARINTALTTREKLQLMGVDHFVISALALSESCMRSAIREEAHFLGRTLDLTAAYKNLACSPSQRWASVLVVPCPSTGQASFFISDALMFGSAASVYAFNRCSRALWHISSVFLRNVCTQFYDDFPCLEKNLVAKSSRLAFELLLNALGWPVSNNPQKALEFSPSFKMLGVLVDISNLHQGTVVVSNLEKRKEDILLELKQAIESRFLERPKAASVFGKLNFAMSAIFGRGAAPGLRLLSNVSSGKCNSKLDDADVESLNSIIHFLVHARPRKISLNDNKRPVCVFTDAAYENGVATYGVVMFIDGKCQVSAGKIPETIVKRWREEVGEQVICQAELYPIVLVKSHYAKVLENRRTLFFIDNDPARYGLIKMTSPSSASVKLIHLFYNHEAEHPSYSWFARVPSSSNPADEPSRGLIDQTLKRFNATLEILKELDGV